MGFWLGFGLMNALFPIIFLVIFVVAVVMLVVMLNKSISRWHSNNQSPRLTVEATVVSRYEDVSTHHHNHGDGVRHTTHSTAYYVTFQVDSGDRIVLEVPRDAYGYIVEGDRGRLSFQGTRFLGFERLS